MPISTILNFAPSLPPSPSIYRDRVIKLPNRIPFFSPPSKTTHAVSLRISPQRGSPLTAFSTNASAATNSEIGGNNNDGNEGGDDTNKKTNRDEALMALAKAGRSLESLPKDLKAAVEDGRIPGVIVFMYLDIEKYGVSPWLMKIKGLTERLSADDLYLARVAMECDVGLFTKTPFSTIAAPNSEINTKFLVACGDGGTGGNNCGSGGDNNYGNEGGGDKNMKTNRDEALMALAETGRTLQSLPKDLKAAFEDGRIPGSIVLKYLALEKSGFLSLLMKIGGFKERLLADDLFLEKVVIECVVGLLIKTAAEYLVRKENFFNEPKIVLAGVVMAIIADFMLVYLSAPTVSLRCPLAHDAGRLANFLYYCPENAFQVGTTVANALKNARKAVHHSAVEGADNVPTSSTSVAVHHSACRVYMIVSSDVRCQIFATVILKRVLEPWFDQHKLPVSVICFGVQAGSTYVGSLHRLLSKNTLPSQEMWLHYLQSCSRFLGWTFSGRIDSAQITQVYLVDWGH